MKKLRPALLLIIIVSIIFSCRDEDIKIQSNRDVIFGELDVLDVPAHLRSVENANVQYVLKSIDYYTNHIRHLQQDFLPDGKEIKLDSNFTSTTRIPPQAFSAMETFYWHDETHQESPKATVRGGHFIDTTYFEYFEEELWGIQFAWIKTNYAWQVNKGKKGSIEFGDWWSERRFTLHWEQFLSTAEIEVESKDYDYGKTKFHFVINDNHSGYAELSEMYCDSSTKISWDVNGFGEWQHVDCYGTETKGSFH